MSRPLRDDDFTIDLTQGEKLIGTFYNIFRGNSNKNSHFPRIKIVFIPLRQNCGEKAIISRQNVLCGCQNNLSPHIFFSKLQCFQRAAMFAPWRSQKPLHKLKDPITGNSLIEGENYFVFEKYRFY